MHLICATIVNRIVQLKLHQAHWTVHFTLQNIPIVMNWFDDRCVNLYFVVCTFSTVQHYLNDSLVKIAISLFDVINLGKMNRRRDFVMRFLEFSGKFGNVAFDCTFIFFCSPKSIKLGGISKIPSNHIQFKLQLNRAKKASIMINIEFSCEHFNWNSFFFGKNLMAYQVFLRVEKSNLEWIF